MMPSKRSVEIRKANSNLKKLEIKLEKALKRNLLPHPLKAIKQELSQTRTKLYALISKELEETNTEYKKLAQSQLKKFGKSAEMKTYRESVGVGVNAVNLFQGKINPNGHLYLTADFTLKTSFFSIIIPIIIKRAYPSLMKGSIDCLGNCSLKATRYWWALFSTLPVGFVSELSSNGDFCIKTTKTQSDFINSHNGIIHKMISSFMFLSPNDLEEFNKTKETLVEMIEEYRKTL